MDKVELRSYLYLLLEICTFFCYSQQGLRLAITPSHRSSLPFQEANNGFAQPAVGQVVPSTSSNSDEVVGSNFAFQLELASCTLPVRTDRSVLSRVAYCTQNRYLEAITL